MFLPSRAIPNAVPALTENFSKNCSVLPFNGMLKIVWLNFESDEYHVRVAKTMDEDREVVEVRFEHATERDGVEAYRKRK